MVCNVQATADEIRRIDNHIKSLNEKIAKAPDPAVYAPEVATVVAEIDRNLREAVAHGGDHDAEWIGQGAPGEGPEYDTWRTSQDITAGWQRRRDAARELERACRPKPRDPDGATTTPAEAFAHTTMAPKANAA